MLFNKLRWLNDSQNLNEELTQCRSEGKDISQFTTEAESIISMPEGDKKRAAAISLMEKLENFPVSNKFTFYEPDDFSEIIATLDHSYSETFAYDMNGYRDNLMGAWEGRCIGCLLGVPVEGWKRDDIVNFLKDTDNYPISGYLSSQVSSDIKGKYNIHDNDETTPYDRQKVCWINNVKEFPVDDDINYSVCALRLVEQYGTDFSTDNVAETWLYALPAMHVCTAERVAYKNLMNCILPPLTAKYLNPFREYIGAQIRVDLYGYIAPGNPSLAAYMAYRDASLSHVKNGIYGAMYIAALISLAPCSKDLLWLVRTAIKQIPSSSRLSNYIYKICDMYDQGKNYDELTDYIDRTFDENSSFDWCHTIPNAMLVTINLLFYGHDYNAAITRTVTCGFDTDCNGATVGSIVGMMLGKSAIDNKWLKPLEPRVNTSIHKYYSLSIDELVERTYKLVHK